MEYLINKIKRHFGNRPKFVISCRKLGDGRVEEIWQVRAELPAWWNDEVHCFIEKPNIYGFTIAKHCQGCNLDVSDQGCVHNKKYK